MRKNLTKQYSKRPWRTPSPSTKNDLRSPHYFRGNLQKIQSNRIVRADGNNQYKLKPLMIGIKNQIIESKQEKSKLLNFEINKDKYFDDQYLIQNNQKQINNEKDSYNSYFTKTPIAYSKYINNYGKNCNKNRNNGLETESNSNLGPIVLHQNKNQSHSTQKQSVKKITQQNLRLRKNLRQVQQNYERLLQKNKKLQEQIQQQKGKRHQIETYHSQIKDLLQKQVQSLKQQLKINNQQFKISNSQIQRLKQELFRYQIPSQKYRIGSQAREGLKIRPEKSKSINKIYAIVQPTQPNTPIQTPKLAFQCQLCKNSQKILIKLNNAIQNKMLEANRKQLIIQSLLIDLKKAQQQIKMLEQPKIIFKKMSLAMQAVNQSAILNGLKRLNIKYKPESY